MSNKLQDARSKLFSSKTYRGPHVDVDIEGVVLEVRSPKAKYALDALKKGGESVFELEELMMTCVYHKETQQPFFDKEHIELLKESSGHADGIVTLISAAIEKVMLTTFVNPIKDEDLGN